LKQAIQAGAVDCQTDLELLGSEIAVEQVAQFGVVIDYQQSLGGLVHRHRLQMDDG
jgi:hypothetical protein